MKKNILLISLLLYTLIVSGQNKIDFDVHAGYGLSYLKGSNTGISANSDVKLGFTGGIGMALPLVKMWFIQPEINYQNIGGGQDKTAIIPLQNYKKFTLQYVSIPVLIKFKIPQSGLGLFAGPQYGYLFSKKLKTISDTFVGTDRLSKSDISAIIGTEYFFPLKGGNQIGFSGRYQFSLDKIDTFNNDELYIKNRVFTLTLGYRF